MLLIKERVEDPWDRVEKGIKNRLGSSLSVVPFCGNLAIIYCEDNLQRKSMLDFGFR